ncbi:UDP-glucose/GDP-mannose dehydrogenase family protein [Streptomyces sp. 5-10]|uniref:UDP-glucose dehydrogenase family protein n=1 Tax=Streptomyces sp. 5-10 TaxID=878925 RepID=UPI00168A6BD6|nr:UDP-glucose/GDP-mannose dehydrogenase family protein [Streptomyces sp. 5-10]MBD3004532.1 UDP-glucose/GDP-mannose dehydrogenase family protein [Streptomyces sp. 5-10]
MRVSVIGCGHLGIPHAAAMAELGHTVIGVDMDQTKVDRLNKGDCPIHEANLQELLNRHIPSGKLWFTTDMSEVAHCDVHFLAVGTPTAKVGHHYETSQLIRAVQTLAPNLTGPCTVIGKSTITAGTSRLLKNLLAEHAPAGESVELVWNPEFLREGRAVDDTLNPDRIVAGVFSDSGERTVREVYSKILKGGVPLFITTPATAELVKGAANAFLAMKISFINGVSDMCRQAGADAIELAEAIGIDPRIGIRGMAPGPGFGGGCLPKDLKAFAASAEELGALDMADLMWSVDRVNSSRPEAAMDLIEDALGGSVAGMRVTLWGAAFKAGTSDVRESPALALADRLTLHGAVVRVHDPQALTSALRERPGLRVAESMEESVSGSDAVVVATEWPQFAAANPFALVGRTPSPTVVDLRNVLDAAQWRRAGWAVRQLGRAFQE